jgi:hypothetical protein
MAVTRYEQDTPLFAKWMADNVRECLMVLISLKNIDVVFAHLKRSRAGQ